MAPRSGGFGGGLNPLGGGSFGGLGQYDIGSDLADLEVYKTEVAWGNGLATDEAYLAALNKALAATDPNTQKRESAQNKLDDATYRIGRSAADTKGLDALVAYDQAAIAKMQPDNVRYRDVKGTLDSELAQRRSRDYGKLVLDYNKGKASTQTLLAWVKSTVGSISPDDPDYANWQGTQQDLTDRIAGEKDSKVYQDFQQGRMKSGPFLAYIQQRRDGFDQSSPDYASWTNRLEDARKQVNDANHTKADNAFFASYEEGHKSDTQYLQYLRGRIKGMKADDPERTSWQHRLNQAAFSLAEDKLRFNVQHKTQPLSALVSFYRSYRSTLNPGSSEWRTITRAMDSIGASGGGSGGGGGGGRSGGGRGGGGSSSSKGVGSAITTKVINPSTVQGALALMTINPYGAKKNQTAAKKFFDLNYTSLENARQRGDTSFLFFDPRHPGSKPIALPVSDDLFGQMNVLKANYQFQLANISLAHKDPGQYAFHLKEGLNAQDKARLVNSQHVQKAFDAFYQTAQDGIDAAMRTGDWATALNLSYDVARRLAAESQNPQLDQVRRDKLDHLGEKLSANPLVPKVDPNTGQQIGGAVDLAASQRDSTGQQFAPNGAALNAGWHHVLDKVDSSGAPDWGLAYDATQDGSWELSHAQVTTSYGNQSVAGEVTKRQAGTNRTIFVSTPEGTIRVDQAVQYLTFTDEHGQVVKAYSIDGQHWIRSLSGTPPQIEVTGNLKSAADGSGITDERGNPVFNKKADGTYTFVGDPSTLGFYGQSARDARLAGAPSSSQSNSALGAFAPERLDTSLNSSDLGAPGQHMEFLTAADDGSLTFQSERQRNYQDRQRGGPDVAITAASRRPTPPGAPPPILTAGQRNDATQLAGTVNSALGMLASGLGLGPKQSAPARLGPVAERRGPAGMSGISLRAPAAIPGLKAAASAPILTAGQKNAATAFPTLATPKPITATARSAKKRNGVAVKPPPPPPTSSSTRQRATL